MFAIAPKSAKRKATDAISSAIGTAGICIPAPVRYVLKTNHAQKVFCCADCAEEYRQIAAEVLLKRRPVIRKMLEKVAADPAIDINELIKKEYPKI